MISPRATFPVVLALALFAPGCKKAEQAKAAEDESPPPDIKVELPGKPNFDEGKTVEKYDDGAYSLYGLREELDENVKAGSAGTETMLRGWVIEIYVPPECPEGQQCPPGKQPHVWIADKPDEQGKKRAMMVVNYKFSIPEWEAAQWKKIPEVVLEKGKQYTFKGKFKQFSDTGFADDRGLLEFVSYRPINPETGQESPEWVAPPGAPWHPVAVAAQEQQNNELIEKAQATALKGGGK